MKQMEKLRVLLPHWIEHNIGHGEECRKWANIAREDGQEKIAALIEDAIEAMSKVNDLLDAALQEAGGPAQESEHHHHHEH